MFESKRRTLQGSFTVEAALLMTILLPVMVALIYASFFLHDRTLLQGAACEVAAMGSNLAEEKDIESRLNEIRKQLVSARLLGTENVHSTIALGEDNIEVSYQGKFSLPGLIENLFGSDSLNISRSWKRKQYHPADTIRKIRGLEYMADTIKG